MDMFFKSLCIAFLAMVLMYILRGIISWIKETREGR